MTAVSYKAIGNAVADLMGRQIQVLFMEYVSGSSHIEGGKVVPLGVTGRERHKAWPGVTGAFDRLGMATRAMSRDEYRRYIAQEIERWAGHVRAAKIEPQ
jgi:tripartite-type tricarboxylate transporter receptor subunit TctC